MDMRAHAERLQQRIRNSPPVFAVNCARRDRHCSTTDFHSNTTGNQYGCVIVQHTGQRVGISQAASLSMGAGRVRS